MKKHIYIFIMMFLSGCARGFESQYQDAGNKIQDGLSCEKSSYAIFGSLRDFALDTQEIPNGETLKEHVFRGLKVKLVGKDPKKSQALEKSVSALLAILVDESQTMTSAYKTEKQQQEKVQVLSQVDRVASWMELISGLDVGDQSLSAYKTLSPKLSQQFAQVQALAKELGLECDQSGNDPGGDGGSSNDGQGGVGSVKRTIGEQASYGAAYVTANAYQSCEIPEFNPMALDSQVLEGIKITGKHSDGIGSKREIASLPLVQKTHYYLQTHYQNSACFDVHNNPLIYDYGGKPKTTSATDSVMDMFADAGSGTKVLGVDCSTYVFMAYATSGLRFQKSRALKAQDVWSWYSGSYLNPQQNGLTCLDKIQLGESLSLKTGDIIAIQGHVVMVANVGADPFGVKRISTVSDCSQVSSDDFDFVISQSSNSKGGIGINNFIAKDYLKGSGTMRAGLEKYARVQCEARLGGKVQKPNYSDISVVRHLGTSECLAPNRVSLSREACLQSCGMPSPGLMSQND